MSDRIHRAVMFVAAVATSIAAIVGLSDTAGVEVVSWLALLGAAAGIVGNSWRILFPETP